MMTKRAALYSLLFLLLAACGRDAGQGAAADTDVPGGIGLEAVADHRLTMEDVRRWYQAQRNVMEKLVEDPALAEQVEIALSAEEFSADDMEARMREIPEVREAIERAGLEVQAFGVITAVLLQASVAQGAIDMGAPRDSVIARFGVHPANLDFVNQNRIELARLQQEMLEFQQELEAGR